MHTRQCLDVRSKSGVIFWKNLRVVVTFFLIAFGPCFCQDFRASLFSKSLNVDRCLVKVGVTLAQDPTTERVRTRAQCASRCLEDERCSKFLYCPHKNNNCIRIKVFGVLDSQEIRQTCDCYIRNQPMPCKNGGILRDGSCMCLNGFHGSECENIIKDCEEGFDLGGEILDSAPFGFAYIQPPFSPTPFPVFCYNLFGGYTYLMVRRGPEYAIDFNRTWQEYRLGFGSIEGDYWLGLEQFHMLSQTQEYLDVAIIDGSGNEINLFYKDFYVESEAGEYSIVAMGFQRHSSNPDAVDSFAPPTNQSINGKPFITYDHNPTGSSCPMDMRCGWWFGDGCTAANLNGPALTKEEYNRNPSQPRITWTDVGYIKYVHMRVSSQD